MALEGNKSTGTQSLFSGGASGYLWSEGALSVGVQQNTGNPAINTTKDIKDVITHISNSAGVTIESNLSTVTKADIVHTNPYNGVTTKYIGAFNNTQFSTAAGIAYYGGVFINKVINSEVEAALRAHFNKRMGI
jgi:hypothetical protein